MAVIEAIETIYLEADVASVLFEDIPTTYEHLQLRMNIASDSTTISGGTYRDWCLVYFNTSTATTNSDYSWYVMYGRGSSAQHSTGVSNHHISLPHCSGTFLGAAHFGACVVDILDYRNGLKNTTTSSMNGAIGPGTGTGEVSMGFSTGVWDNVAAVTKVLLIPDVGSNWRRGSEFTLFGLASS